MKIPWFSDQQDALHALRAIDAICELCADNGSVEIYISKDCYIIKVNGAWTNWQARVHGETSLYAALINVQRMKQQSQRK